MKMVTIGANPLTGEAEFVPAGKLDPKAPVPVYSQAQIDWMLEDEWQTDLAALGRVRNWDVDHLKNVIAKRKMMLRIMGRK